MKRIYINENEGIKKEKPFHAAADLFLCLLTRYGRPHAYYRLEDSISAKKLSIDDEVIAGTVSPALSIEIKRSDLILGYWPYRGRLYMLFSSEPVMKTDKAIRKAVGNQTLIVFPYDAQVFSDFPKLRQIAPPLPSVDEISVS